MRLLPEVLYEDNHCLAVNKPAGVPSTHFEGTVETLDRVVKRYLKAKYKKPGNVFLGVVHRLDKPVSGVLVFARTSKAAARLAPQFRERTVEKTYWAVVEGELSQPFATLVDWLAKDERARRIQVVSAENPGAQHAELDYALRNSHCGLHWLEIRPRTGRKHQLRVQLAARGMPIYGDTKYGSRRTFGHAICLHARSLQFRHPIRDELVTVVARIPASWAATFYGLVTEPSD